VYAVHGVAQFQTLGHVTHHTKSIMKTLHALLGLLICSFLSGCADNADNGEFDPLSPGPFTSGGVTYYPAHPGTTNYDYTTNPPPAGVLPFVSVVTTNAGDGWPPVFFTNTTAIANGSTVLAAVRSGDTQSKASVQALIGSQVVFVGGAAPPGGTANLIVASNVVLEVEIRPVQDVRPHSATWSAEVLGTLNSVDFEKRVIHIRAKPEDWRVRDTY